MTSSASGDFVKNFRVHFGVDFGMDDGALTAMVQQIDSAMKSVKPMTAGAGKSGVFSEASRVQDELAKLLSEQDAVGASGFDKTTASVGRFTTATEGADAVLRELNALLAQERAELIASKDGFDPGAAMARAHREARRDALGSLETAQKRSLWTDYEIEQHKKLNIAGKTFNQTMQDGLRPITQVGFALSTFRMGVMGIPGMIGDFVDMAKGLAEAIQNAFRIDPIKAFKAEFDRDFPRMLEHARELAAAVRGHIAPNTDQLSSRGELAEKIREADLLMSGQDNKYRELEAKWKRAQKEFGNWAALPNHGSGVSEMQKGSGFQSQLMSIERDMAANRAERADIDGRAAEARKSYNDIELAILATQMDQTIEKARQAFLAEELRQKLWSSMVAESSAASEAKELSKNLAASVLYAWKLLEPLQIASSALGGIGGGVAGMAMGFAFRQMLKPKPVHLNFSGSKFSVTQHIETNDPSRLAGATLAGAFGALVRRPLSANLGLGSVGVATGG